MKYNSKYDRWVTNGGLVYRYSKSQDKLVLCKLTLNNNGYHIITCQQPKKGIVSVHRMVYETFVGEIPQGYEIDHINTIRNDNRLENLRLVTHSGNMLNPITRKRESVAHKGKIPNNVTRKKMSVAQKGRVHTEETKKKLSELKLNKPKSEFGKKYFEHFGYSLSEDVKQYDREFHWYRSHNNKCRWE